MWVRRGALIVAVSIVWAALGAGGARAAEFVSIGTGGVTGVYFPAGGAICRLVNKDRKDHGVRCSVESTFGSVFNINAIRTGDLDLGLAQSDTQYSALRGEGPFDKRGPYGELRAVFSLHAEPVTLMARADSGIKHINDVKGRRMNIGNPGSGTLATWQVIEQALGWTRRDLGLAAEFKANQQGEALCDNKIDAFFALVGHPSAATRETANACAAVLVPIDGPGIQALVKTSPFYRWAVIPGGMYRGNPKDVKTFGVGATLVSSTKTKPEIVYSIVKAVFDNFDAFRDMHPALANLRKDEMVRDSLTAPLHAGAVRYFREAGLIK